MDNEIKLVHDMNRELGEIKAQLQSAGTRAASLSTLINSAELSLAHENDAREELTKLETEIKKRTGGICPVCGKKL